MPRSRFLAVSESECAPGNVGPVSELSGERVPRHVAIVMDGNGRWAKNRKLPRPLGHREGVKAVRKVVEACASRGIEVLTLFAFSSENWRRPAAEVSLLMSLFLTTLRGEVQRLRESNVKLRFIGDRSAFSEKIQEYIDLAEQQTAACSGLTLVIAVNYGGRWDIAQAARSLAEDVAAGQIKPDSIDADAISKRVSLADLPEPDLFIRTGGEERVSNFLLWQMAYTEFYFTGHLWPDFNAELLDEAIESFSNRQRRFGRTGDQIEQGENA